MNIAIDIDKFNQNNIFFYEPVKNTVMDDSNFIRIIYSNKLLTLNGLFIKIKFNITNTEKYFNKFKCTYNIEDNKQIINNLVSIENNILQKYCYIENKIVKHKIYDQLYSGSIKLFKENSLSTICNVFILKISGIWETDTEYGLTYKFIDITNHQ